VPLVLAQVAGAAAGAVLLNAMFDLPPVQVAATPRGSAGAWLGEVVATAGLVALVVALARTGRTGLAAPAVAPGSVRPTGPPRPPRSPTPP
jgi:glycerol uptake facilitator-like aquaporin